VRSCLKNSDQIHLAGWKTLQLDAGFGVTLIKPAPQAGQTPRILAMFSIRIPVFVDTSVQYTFVPLPVL
jgi:hypothetical protein